MITYKGITITPEAIIAAATALVSLVGWLRSRNKLPSAVNRAVDRIGWSRIENMVWLVSDISSDANVRREEAIRRIQQYCEHQDITIPEGYIRMAVEYAYQKLLKKRL